MLLVLLAAAGVAAAPAAGQTPRQIRVDVQFRQTATQSRNTAGAAGGVIVSPRGGLRPRGGVGAGSTETLVQQSTGIFTLVQDGGESILTVASQVPYPQGSFYRDFASGAGYSASGLASPHVRSGLSDG